MFQTPDGSLPGTPPQHFDASHPQTAPVLTPPDLLPPFGPQGANGRQPPVSSGKPDSSLSLPMSSHALSPPGPILQAVCPPSALPPLPAHPLPRSWASGLPSRPSTPAAILGSTGLSYLKICCGVLLRQNEGHSQAPQALLRAMASRPAPLAGVPRAQAPCSLPCPGPLLPALGDQPAGTFCLQAFVCAKVTLQPSGKG